MNCIMACANRSIFFLHKVLVLRGGENLSPESHPIRTNSSACLILSMLECWSLHFKVLGTIYDPQDLRSTHALCVNIIAPVY